MIFVIVQSPVFERCCIRQTLLGASYPNIMPNQKAATITKNCENGYVCAFEKVASDTICLSSVCLSANSLRSVWGICCPTAPQQAQPSQPCRNPLCKYPKGCIKFKSSCCKGASRWRTKGSATSLLPARKQHGCIKRGLWSQAQLQSVQEAVSLRENTKIIVGTQFYKLAARLRRFKCTYPSSLHFPYWNKSLCHNKWGFSPFPYADEQCTGEEGTTRGSRSRLRATTSN